MTRLIAGELRKLSTIRLWLWLLLAAMALTALYAGLNIAFTDDPDNFAPHLSTVAGQRLHYATAASAATVMGAVVAAIGITGEFRHRTATATFLATPQRRRVVAAKLVTYAALGAGYAVACLSITLAVGLPWLANRGIDLSLTADGVPATLGGVVAAGAVFGLLGVAVGALVREQAAAVVGLLVYQFVAEPIVAAVPALRDWTRFLPGEAASALAGSSLENREFLPAWGGGLVLLGYALMIAVAGSAAVARRDVA